MEFMNPTLSTPLRLKMKWVVDFQTPVYYSQPYDNIRPDERVVGPRFNGKANISYSQLFHKDERTAASKGK